MVQVPPELPRFKSSGAHVVKLYFETLRHAHSLKTVNKMRFSGALLCLAATLSKAMPVPATQVALPPYFILSGDSTTAPAGGWGDGFLQLPQNGAEGVNHAKSGATTVSIRSSGYWTNAINAVKSHVGTHEPIVTIQFGHNDQKEEAGISLSQFQTNMQNLAKEVIAAGGTPVSAPQLLKD
jgi:lysophospholipase L1-like esterase